MRVITENTIRPLCRSSVVTIGNYDGVHLGHRALIERCIERSGKDSEVVVVTFDPLPQGYFAPGSAPARLSPDREKLELLEQSGVDLVWVMRFNQQLAEMSATSFAESVLSQALGARAIVVGEDFRFGRAREGDLALLQTLGHSLGFEVLAVADIEVSGQRVSSTAVREALARGDFEQARSLLGRSFTMQGEVIRGSRLGRKLGYPTANMRPEAEPSPLAGVFAVRVRKPGEEQWSDAVSSLGRRPAVGGTEFLVEVHIFDFSGDLYDQRLEVEFVAKIRDEQNFPSVEDLVKQMKKDEASARKILRD